MNFVVSSEPWNLLGRILVAAALGGILGIERDIHGRQIIELVKSKEVAVTSFGIERDHETLMTNARISWRLFYRGDVDNLSHLIVEKLEQSNIPLKAVKCCVLDKEYKARPQPWLLGQHWFTLDIERTIHLRAFQPMFSRFHITEDFDLCWQVSGGDLICS